MPRTIFVAPIGSKTGKTTFCLSLISSLKKTVPNVGYIKPVGQQYRKGSMICEDTSLISGVFGLESDGQNLCPTSIQDVEKHMLAGKEKQVLDIIAAAHEKIAASRETIVIEGADMASMSSVQTDLNISIAERLHAKVLLLISGAGAKSIEEITYQTVHAKEAYETARCTVIGVVINRVQQDTFKQFDGQVRKQFNKHKIDVIGVIPSLPVLGAVSMRDVTEAIDGEIIIDGNMNNLAHKMIVAAMRPSNVLTYLNDEALVITPGDRDDVLVTVACSDISESWPSLAGVVLTGNIRPDDIVIKLICGMGDMHFPVVLTKNDTFTTASIVDTMEVNIRLNDIKKIDAAKTLAENYCDCERIYDLSGITVVREKTPVAYLDDIVQRAKRKTMRIVLPEGTDERVLTAAAQIKQSNIADITLLGEIDVIQQKAKKIGVSLQGIDLKNPMTGNVDTYAEKLYELRKHRDVGIHQARDLVRDPVYYGTMMVAVDDADGLVSGAAHSTADTLRPALQIIGTSPTTRFISSVFLMLKGSKAFFYGDCAIIEDPDEEQLAAIAINSACIARSFNIKPVVAMLSYSTGKSGKGSSVEKIRKATKLVKKMAPDIPIEGPVQYDAAFDEQVARLKLPDSKVAGHVNVFIFPDLNSGNIAYKAVQREAGAIALGPICYGFRKPVNDLSRGCSVEDIVYVVAITAIQAQENSLKKAGLD